MSDRTRIEWTDATWNPLRGCSRVSEGCRHCYAEGQAARIIAMDRGRGIPEGQGAYDGLLAPGGQWNGKVRLVESVLDQPLRWTTPRRIFVNSMSDLFHESVSDATLNQIFCVMAMAKNHTFQVLTKRPQRMRDYIQSGERSIRLRFQFSRAVHNNNWPLPNVWIGVSVENQATADERIPLLLDTPAAVRWLSMEPLLGPVSLPRVDFHCDLCGGTGILGRFPKGTCHHCNGRKEIPAISTDPKYGTPATPMRRIDWVVVGGESGPNARPMHPDWPKYLRRQCIETNTPFLFKQWGEWVPRSACHHTFADDQDCVDLDPQGKRWPSIVRLTYDGRNARDLSNHTDAGDEAFVQRVGKRMAGRLLDGRLHDEYPPQYLEGT